MAELGIIASVIQIADVGLRLSLKLYTFGEVVASADRSVISISKDVSLTSGVLKELGQILDKDRESRTFSENAVQTADVVVKECLEVFQEMENILVKKLPSLGAGGREGKGWERVKRATVMLERLKWGYLQPKLELLRSNLDRLKSTLLLMLNVIAYAKQVSEKTEAPSMIAEQRSLIEDLAHSNQEYIRDFERLKLRMDGPAGDRVDDASNSRVVERESSNTTRPSSEVPTSQFERINSTIWGTSPQDNENARGIESKELTTAMRRSPKAQSCLTGTLTTPPNANINNVFINTGAQANLAMPSVQERGIPTTEAPMGFEQEVLFKQLEHYSMLIKNLLKEVDEAQYKITFKSRLRMKGGIAGLHEGERREFEKTWGCTALQSAEQRLDSLAEGLEELPRINRYGASFTSTRSSRYTAHSTDTSQVIDAAYPWLSHQSDSSSRGTKNSAMPGISSSLPMGIDFSTTYITPERPRNDPPNDQPFGMPVKRTKRTLAARKSRTRRTEETEQPHEQKDGTGEGGADATTQPDTPSISASSRPQFGGPLSVAEYEEIPYRLEAVVDEGYSTLFNSDLSNFDILENFDFEKFLENDEGSCQRCRSAKIQCDGKLPACTACEEALQGAECSIFSDSSELPETPRDPSSRAMPAPSPCTPTLYDRGSVLPGKRRNSRSPLSVFNTQSAESFQRKSEPDDSKVDRLQPLKRSSKLDDSKLADIEVVDRLVSLWTTVKP